MTQSEVTYPPPPGLPPHFQQYLPPPGPPPPEAIWYPPPLLDAPFPLLSQQQVQNLSTQGFATFPIADRPSLHDAAVKLFSFSRHFFAQAGPEKEAFQIKHGNAQGSEEGWSRVVGEKELLTLRRSGKACPEQVEEAGRTLWRECGLFMRDVISAVEISLNMQEGLLWEVVEKECAMPNAGEDRVETLLRMFRYERRLPDTDDASAHEESMIGKGRLVAEPHRDLGILSLVIGLSPGLEVFDTSVPGWIPIEQPPHASPALSSGLTATLLVGETLSYLTNNRYLPGRHRVFVPSYTPLREQPEDSDAQFRFSLVFALRPHGPTLISTDRLTTGWTGVFRRTMKNGKAKDLFSAIAKTHWNINTGQNLREQQRKRLMGQGDSGRRSTAGKDEEQVA